MISSSLLPLISESSESDPGLRTNWTGFSRISLGLVVLNYLMDKTLLGFAVNTVTLLSKLCSVLLPLFDKVANLQFEP